MGLNVKVESTHGTWTFHTSESMVSHLDTDPAKSNVRTIARLLDGWTALLADSPLNCGRRSQKPLREFVAFRNDFLKGPLLEFVRRYSSLADQLLKQPQLFGASPETGEWISDFRNTPVFKEYHHWFRTGDVASFRFLTTFLIFGKKLKYEDKELNATAFRGWLDVEERLSHLSFNVDRLSNLKAIVTELVPDLGDFNLEPRFGPGTVAEKGIRGNIQKSNNLQYDPKIDRAFFRNPKSWGKEELGRSPVKVIPNHWDWSSASRMSARVSELLFVWRDLFKARSICREPNTYMFAQQAVQTAMRQTLRKTCARRFIDISDQSRNRELAQYGSATGLIDTIDLSAASDSVHIDLVKGIFPRSILYYLLATRTSKVKVPGGAIVDVKKFAPMGSAVCFPVQCIVFTSVVIYAAMLHADGRAATDVLPADHPYLKDVTAFVTKNFRREVGWAKGTYEPAAIFGDDICVDSTLTPYVTHLLLDLGFDVNLSKSFTSNVAVRESCGGYYYGGEDITPTRFRSRQVRQILSDEECMTNVAGANLAGDRGLRNLRRFLINWTKEFARSREIVTYTDNRNLNYLVYSKDARNLGRRRRVSPDIPNGNNYMRIELQVYMPTVAQVVRPKQKEAAAFENYRYLQWWEGKSEVEPSEVDSYGAASVLSRGMKLRRRWIPV